jgi:hypothetical protein
MFRGAGWVLFEYYPSMVEVYKGIDGEPANLFRVVMNAHRVFVQAIDWILVIRRMFDDFHRTDPLDTDENQRTVRFFN